MTATGTTPRLTRLTFHGPLSQARAARIVRRLASTEPTTVLDLGCGWGELMLRLLEEVPGASGIGIDVSSQDLDRGRTNAGARGLADRVDFTAGSAAGTARGPADTVLCVGSSHALSDDRPPLHTLAALKELRRLVAPGGRVLFGESFWQRPPTPAELDGMWPGAEASELLDLRGLIDAAVGAGFRVEWVETASEEEWEEFESGYLADVEVWLARHGDHPDAEAARDRADRHRAAWTHYRRVLGLAYLTLIPVG
jgi:cyclopropane fatty-acyl-phospholipid synthase-like methyltransferase